MAALNKELDPRFAKAFGVFAGAIGFLVLYFFFASLGKLVPAHSDSSYLILYADAMLKGNWLLQGWDLTTVSFYTELPFYLVAVKFAGVQPDLIRYVPAFIYALNVTLVIALIWKYRIDKGYWIFLPAVAFLILPSNGIWPLALNGAIHMVTLTVGLVMLLILNDKLVLQKASRSIVLAVVCMLGVWGDLAFAFYFLLPLIAAGFILHWGNQENTKSFFKSVAVPALVGGIVGHLLILFARAMNWGAPVGNGIQMFESQELVIRKGQILVDSWINFFGPDMWGMPLGMVSLAKVILGLGVIWWILAAVEAYRNRDSGFDLFALLMPFSIAAAVIISSHAGGGDETRFIVPAFFVAIVAMSRYAQRRATSKTWRLAPIAVSLAAVVVTARFVTDNRTLLAGDAYMSQYKEAVSLLAQRGVSDGFGDYWSTQVMRVASKGQLSVMPLDFTDKGVPVPFAWASDRTWFDRHSGKYAIFQGIHGTTLQQHLFARLQGKNLLGNFKSSHEAQAKLEKGAIEYWGEPAERLQSGDLIILIWPTDVVIKDEHVPDFLKIETITR